MPSSASLDLRVLVIGELEGCANHYKRLLQQETGTSYQVVEALYSLDPLMGDGLPVDSILLDIPLLRFDCLEVLRQVRSQIGEACPPIIVIGEADTSSALQAGKAGAADYLVREQLTSKALDLSLRTAIENAALKRELRQQEEQFQVSIENMQDCFGIFTAMRDESGQIFDFRIDYLNQAACANNQMTREEQVGQGLCEVLPGHRESGLFDEYCQLVETGEPLVKDSLIYDDVFDGQRIIRAFDIRANKLNDGFVASWRNITNRKQLELELSNTVASLQQQQNYLQQLLNTAPIGIGIGSTNGDVRLINDTMLALHGLTRDDFERDGMNWCDFCPPEYVDRIEPAMTQLRQQGFLPPEEKELLRPDGTRVPVWISATQASDNPDEHVSFAVDLTAQKQTEAALKASQQRYQELAEAMPQMVWTADATGAVNYWNQRWYDYTGTNLDEMKGWGWQKVHHPDHVDRVVEVIKHSFETGEEWEDTFPLRSKDGEYRWFLSRAKPIRNREGKIVRWFGTNTDITENLEQKEALRRSEERLDMARNAADIGIHDYDVVNDRIYWDPIVRRIWGVEGDEESITYNVFKSGVHPEDLPAVEANRVLLVWALENCVKNSLDALAGRGGRRGRRGRIRVAVFRRDGGVGFLISDNGPGVSHRIRDRLFEPGVTTKPGGWGVGLSLARRIVEAVHGGKIRSVRRPGGGARFEIRIPESSGRRRRGRQG